MKLADLISMAIEEAEKRMQENKIAADFGSEEKKEIARRVGLAALKYSDLSNHRTSDYVFDLEKFTRFEGKTGPYHLYAAVRMKSILRKAAEQGIEQGSFVFPGPEEKKLWLQIFRVPEILEKARENQSPNIICEYAWDLAQTYSSFYQTCHILRESDPDKRASWLAVTMLTLKLMETLLDLIGLKIPERM